MKQNIRVADDESVRLEDSLDREYGDGRRSLLEAAKSIKGQGSKKKKMRTKIMRSAENTITVQCFEDLQNGQVLHLFRNN